MATWHPPIPAEKLYSEPSLRLGPALAMLVWCYDNVHRDGTIEVLLDRVATDMSRPYGTIRDWWRMLRAGPFFCEQIDRGKRGWVVRMASDWLDWHVMRNNYPVNAEISADTIPSKQDDRRDLSVEDGESEIKAKSKQDDRRDLSVDRNVYGTQDSDLAKTQREREDRDRTARSLSLEHPAVAIYRAAFPDIQINEQQGASIIDLVGDVVERLECWRATVQDYTLSPHWKPENIGNMRNRFERLLREKQQNGNRNGHSNGITKPLRPNLNGHSERKPQVEADPERGF